MPASFGAHARFAERLHAAALDGLNAGGQPIDPCDNDRAFADRYRLTIDRQPLDWSPVGYSHMREVYEDDHPDQVIMAGAQTGKTARALTRYVRGGVVKWGGFAGYYFPDFPLAGKFSRDRFVPFVRSSSELRKWLGQAEEQDRKGANEVLSRTFGASTFYFLSTRGGTATESVPMQVLVFDELRRMQREDVQRAELRTEAQVAPWSLKVSTAFYPDGDIHAAFMAGDQRYFHTGCDCPDGVILSQAFPECAVWLRGSTPEFRRKVEHAFTMAGLPWLGMTPRDVEKFGEAVLVCPTCGTIVTNPRDGWWAPHNEGAWAHSYQLPQLLTPSQSAARCLKRWENPEGDVQENFNSILGLPYVDAEARPVTLDHLLGCVNPQLHWPANMTDAWRRKYVRNCAMGIDSMGGFNCAVVKALAPNGKFRTVHVAVLHGDDPWRGCARLMQLYDVRLCVADQLPNYNEAHRFAKAFPGRVFLASYTNRTGGEDTPLVDWKDRAIPPPGQKGDETAFKYRVTINRTKGLKWSLGRWGRHLNETPDPAGLLQLLPRQSGKVMLTAGLRAGVFEPVPICRDVYFDHQTRVVFRKDYANDDAKRRGDFKLVAEHLGLDPHFAHADLYANVALARLRRPAFGEDEE